MPTDVGVVDLMLSIPRGNEKDWYQFLKPQLREESKDYEFPVQYMFKDVPHLDPGKNDPVDLTLHLMDQYGIDKAMVGVGLGDPSRNRGAGDMDAVTKHPDRFIPSLNVDPNHGMDGVRDLVKAYETIGIKAATAFPAGCNPQVPINDKKFYPFYAKCVELDIPICVCTGVCGPRVPSACQETFLIDEVCWYFPELKFVMRHGAEPWADVAAKLMLKWPNLYYSTSAFAPRYYPKEILDFANTRGADKVMYAGYFPMGLSLDRIMRELPDVPLKADVWPKFLRENAMRVFKLD
jgi:predicted TIM-barrel fold metal-dependent hydrolase